MRFILLHILFIYNCAHSDSQQKQLDNFPDQKLSIEKASEELKPYSDFLLETKESIAEAQSDEKKKMIFQTFYKDLPAYWVRTDWDFNGVTRQPQKGSIACGYFVTNILSDLGVSLQRVYLAQQPSSVMIKKLSKPGTVKRYPSFKELQKNITNIASENDIMIVGLDMHTGFLLKNGNDLYFFHSDYVSDQVQMEKAEDSRALQNSNSYMIGSILQNTTLF